MQIVYSSIISCSHASPCIWRQLALDGIDLAYCYLLRHYKCSTCMGLKICCTPVRLRSAKSVLGVRAPILLAVIRGLIKYRSLVKFNIYIIRFSLSMDGVVPEGIFSNAEEGRARLLNKSFASVSRNQRTLVEEIDDVLDVVSIELQEVPNGTTGINCQQETMSDADKFASRYSCIDAEQMPSSHGTDSIASFRENRFASKEDDDTRPLRDKQHGDQKAIGLLTNDRANNRCGIRSPPPSWKRAQ
ncbi:Uncharacterized protein HZ326_24171 [Fusarium oxysporum f. sp. albedinis]|nr:Uncharacterized protein HZ326_24171 [Fusarium oxysporum f. sp. albedinis]